jgi:hypothetical protein
LSHHGLKLTGTGHTAKYSRFMQSPHKNDPIKSGPACRAKAASLREEARTMTSIAAKEFLEIAHNWETLAADYERVE